MNQSQSLNPYQSAKDMLVVGVVLVAALFCRSQLLGYGGFANEAAGVVTATNTNEVLGTTSR